MEVGTLTPETTVENEECAYCFRDFDDPEGVNICLQCFSCLCDEHAKKHFSERQHTLFLNRKRITTKSEKEATKLAIGTDGGFDDIHYSYEYSIRMYDENEYQEIPEECIDDENALKVVQDLKSRQNSSVTDLVQAWELKVEECPHTKNISQTPCGIAPKMHCSKCDKDNNLWLCLTCGHVGCGRRQFDGSGGNEHAIQHFKETGHPVCAKLGTILPDGRCDLFCYACDESVSDAHIVEHLQALGVDVENAVKTEKTTTETELERNKNWDFSTVTKDGHEFDVLHGQFSTGLKNLGNTCYMNSILQTLMAIPEFVTEFTGSVEGRWTDPQVQFRRLFNAMQKGDAVVSPRLLRNVVCHGNQQFLSAQQQDAIEFFQYIANFIEVHYPTCCLSKSTFDAISAIQCINCHDVSTSPQKDQHILVLTPPIPTGDEELQVPIDVLLENSFVHQLEDRSCDKCSQKGAISTQYFTNFPDYLFVGVMLDAVNELGMQRKINVNIQFDPDNFDLTKYKSTVEAKIDEKMVEELMGLGFTRPQCVAALENVSGIEAAVDWIMEHPMEVSPAVAQVMEMGFSEDEAREALQETDGNIGLAIEWLFGPRTKKQRSARTDGNGIYELIAFIQHKGSSATCGHYVATVKRDGKWVLYNDEKVNVYPPEEPPQFGKGYLYLFKRK